AVRSGLDHHGSRMLLRWRGIDHHHVRLLWRRLLRGIGIVVTANIHWIGIDVGRRDPRTEAIRGSPPEVRVLTRDRKPGANSGPRADHRSAAVHGLRLH